MKGVQFFWAVDLHVGNTLVRHAQDEVFVGLLLHRYADVLLWRVDLVWMGCLHGEKI